MLLVKLSYAVLSLLPRNGCLAVTRDMAVALFIPFLSGGGYRVVIFIIILGN